MRPTRSARSIIFGCLAIAGSIYGAHLYLKPNAPPAPPKSSRPNLPQERIHDLRSCQRFGFSGPLIAQCADVLADPVARGAARETANKTLNAADLPSIERECAGSGSPQSAAYRDCVQARLMTPVWRATHDEILKQIAQKPR
jgi:hypothetical protein